MMVVTYDARDLPHAILVLPEVNELRLPGRLCVIAAWMVESVNSYLKRAIAMHGIHLERSSNEFSAHLAAEIDLDALEEALPGPVYQTAIVVVELQVICEEAAKLLQIASIASVEECAVQRRDSAMQVVNGSCISPGLGICWCDDQGE
jgi:hypothetical protein